MTALLSRLRCSMTHEEGRGGGERGGKGHARRAFRREGGIGLRGQEEEGGEGVGSRGDGAAGGEIRRTGRHVDGIDLVFECNHEGLEKTRDGVTIGKPETGYRRRSLTGGFVQGQWQ